MKVRIVDNHDMCHPETCNCWDWRAEKWEEERIDGIILPSGWYRLGLFSNDYQDLEDKIVREYPNALIVD